MPQKGTTLRGRGYGLWEDALMDVQCSYNPPTILLLSPDYGSTQLRAAQRVHQQACRMADCAVGRNREKEKAKEKKEPKKRK